MELNEQVCAVIERETGDKVTPKTPVDELRGDSLDFTNLLFEIEQATGKSISSGRIPGLQTVRDIIEALC